MIYTGNKDPVIIDEINYAIATLDQFSDHFVVKLWNNPTGLWKFY